MSSGGDRRLGMMFGLVGALLLILAGLLDLVSGVVFVAFGHGSRAFGAWSESVVLIVVGVLIGFFAFFGRTHDRDRSFAAGLILVVLAVVGWLVLGFATGVVPLLGSVFVLVGGVLFLASGR
jgi:hypothetical protein